MDMTSCHVGFVVQHSYNEPTVSSWCVLQVNFLLTINLQQDVAVILRVICRLLLLQKECFYAYHVISSSGNSGNYMIFTLISPTIIAALSLEVQRIRQSNICWFACSCCQCYFASLKKRRENLRFLCGGVKSAFRDSFYTQQYFSSTDFHNKATKISLAIFVTKLKFASINTSTLCLP